MPWSLSEARTSFLTGIAGVALLVWGWWGSSGSGQLSRQTDWADSGVVGVVLIVIAAVIWVSSGRRAVKARKDLCAEGLEQLFPNAARGAGIGDVFVFLPGSNRYHRGDCLLVAGKHGRSAPIGSGELSPCEMCRP